MVAYCYKERARERKVCLKCEHFGPRGTLFHIYKMTENFTKSPSAWMLQYGVSRKHGIQGIRCRRNLMEQYFKVNTCPRCHSSRALVPNDHGWSRAPLVDCTNLSTTTEAGLCRLVVNLKSWLWALPSLVHEIPDRKTTEKHIPTTWTYPPPIVTPIQCSDYKLRATGNYRPAHLDHSNTGASANLVTKPQFSHGVCPSGSFLKVPAGSTLHGNEPCTNAKGNTNCCLQRSWMHPQLEWSAMKCSDVRVRYWVLYVSSSRSSLGFP